MTMQYVRNYYGVPAKRGGRVEINRLGKIELGTIMYATHYVHIRPDNEPRRRLPYHPLDVKYLQPLLMV